MGAPPALLRTVCRAVLAAGSKSCSHCYVLLERHAPVLRPLLDAAGAQAGQRALLDVLGETYGHMTQRMTLALERCVWLCSFCAGACVHRTACHVSADCVTA